MNIAFTTILSSLIINPTVSIINGSIQNVNEVAYAKEDISKFKLNHEIIHVKENEENFRQFVYLEMMNRYEKYSDFFIDLLLNRKNYLISGDNFKFPEDPKGMTYKITIVSMPTNKNYTGKLVFEVKLFPEIERIDLSKFNEKFKKNDLTTYAVANVTRSNISSTLTMTDMEVLKAIDRHFSGLGIKEWTRNQKILESQFKDIEVTPKTPHITEGYVEGYFEVAITPKESSKLLLPNLLTCFIYTNFKYESLSKSINHTLNRRLGSSWSKLNTWTWENGHIWYTTLNIADYLTKAEKNVAGGNYVKAFAKKYQYLRFGNDSYGIDYDDIKHSGRSPNFAMEQMSQGTEYIFEIVSFKKTGFGVYSEVDHYITIRITSGYNLEYRIYGFVGVRGFGAKWQYTSLYSKIFSWRIS